jgi:hypothetical protein
VHPETRGRLVQSQELVLQLSSPATRSHALTRDTIAPQALSCSSI